MTNKPNQGRIRRRGEDAPFKERRNPSADAHEEPMIEGEALSIVPSWTRAIRYRPSLHHRFSLTRFPIRDSRMANADSVSGAWNSPIDLDFILAAWGNSILGLLNLMLLGQVFRLLSSVSGEASLRNDLMHDVAMHVGRAEVAAGVAEGEAFVVEA